MSIQEINDTGIVHRCDHCGATRQLDFEVISKASEPKENEIPLAPNIIPMPPCEKCPTVEFLFVNNEVGNEAGSRNQRLINELFHRLNSGN